MSRLIDADAFIKHVCSKDCNSREECDHKGQMCCQFVRIVNEYAASARHGISNVQTNMYDTAEYHFNCAVQVLKNSTTGETSVGWTPMGSDIAQAWEQEAAT